MKRILIKYRSGDGTTSSRSVSDWQPDGEDAIDAFCHLRSERRTFKLMNILSVADAETGEILPNSWRTFGLDKTSDGRERLNSILGVKLIALKILKFYAKSTRGFSRRERDHIVNFALQGIHAVEPQRDAVDAWLKELWAGDVYAYQSGDKKEYNSLLAALPPQQLPDVRVTAELIARGSGRRPLLPEAAQRIARDFSNAR